MRFPSYEETNIYTEKVVQGPGVRHKSRIGLYKNLNMTVLKVFLGLLVHMLTIQLP